MLQWIINWCLRLLAGSTQAQAVVGYEAGKSLQASADMKANTDAIAREDAAAAKVGNSDIDTENDMKEGKF